MFAVYRDNFCFVLVNWTTDTGITIFSSITPLSNNRVVICGGDNIKTMMLKCYDISTRTELDCVELKCEARGIAEVKYANTLSLVVSFP